MVDILIDDSGQMATAANGDVMTVLGSEELLQEIQLEARTAEGDCFYDNEYGWSLLDFVQSEITELVNLQIQQRIKEKLKKYTEINQESINVTIIQKTDYVSFKVKFKINNEDYDTEVNLDRVKAEVV